MHSPLVLSEIGRFGTAFDFPAKPDSVACNSGSRRERLRLRAAPTLVPSKQVRIGRPSVQYATPFRWLEARSPGRGLSPLRANRRDRATVRQWSERGLTCSESAIHPECLAKNGLHVVDESRSVLVSGSLLRATHWPFSNRLRVIGDCHRASVTRSPVRKANDSGAISPDAIQLFSRTRQKLPLSCWLVGRCRRLRTI